jgi:uncharacterized protein
MKIKTCPVRVKAAGDGPAGEFEAIVSVFGNKDSYGDVVLPGAFTDTLAEWASKGDPIPVYWSHRTSDPQYCIGQVLEAKETDVGLWVRAQLNLDNPTAAATYGLLKDRLVTQFSFAYSVKEGAYVQSDEMGSYYELRKLDLYEVGPTPVGANPDTELLDVKALIDGVKAGRVLSAKNETSLRTAYDEIGAVLAALDEPPKSARGRLADGDTLVDVDTLDLQLGLAGV